MKHITNIRELRQMRCEGAELCTVVSICVGDLERIAEVAEANLRDKFALSAVSGMIGYIHVDDIGEKAYRIADLVLKARNK